MKTYGPYERKDGRKHVIHYDGRTRKTQSYPRYLMEQKLQRKMLDTEEVDHKDDNFKNDDIENLQILTPKNNRIKEITREERKAKWTSHKCPICSESFSKRKRESSRNTRENKAGPFCTKRCAGIYGAQIRYNK